MHGGEGIWQVPSTIILDLLGHQLIQLIAHAILPQRDTHAVLGVWHKWNVVWLAPGHLQPSLIAHAPAAVSSGTVDGFV